MENGFIVANDFDNEPHYQCPYCGSEYTHQYKVDVYERLNGEDGETGCISIVDGVNIKTEMIPKEDKRNPSIRRNSIRVWFWCEGCRMVSSVTISQHKGVSFFSVEPTIKEEVIYPCVFETPHFVESIREKEVNDESSKSDIGEYNIIMDYKPCPNA